MSGVIKRSRWTIVKICICLAAASVANGQSTNMDSIQQGCVGGEVLLSQNSSLVPPESVRASSSLTATPPSNVYDSITTWCASNISGPNPYVDMEFTSPLLISMMITTGSTVVGIKEGVYYVTNFTLEYSSPEDPSDLNYYTDSGEMEDIKYFEASGFITLIQFERPILTRRIRLTSFRWYDSDGDRYSVQYICQGVALYGCLGSDLGVTVEEEVTAAVVRADRTSLSIVLSVSLLTIAVLLILLALLSGYVYTSRRAATKQAAAPPDHDYSHLDRSIKSIKSISMSSLHSEEQKMNVQKAKDDMETGYANFDSNSRQSSVIKKVENPIYGNERSTHMDRQESTQSPITELTDYEPIHPDEVQTSHKVDQQSSSRAGRNIYSDIHGDNEDNMATRKVNYEAIIVEQNTISTADPVDMEACARDSMIDNTAYNTVMYDGQNALEGEDTGAIATDEHVQYEEVVVLQRNTSYEYIKTTAADLVQED